MIWLTIFALAGINEGLANNIILRYEPRSEIRFIQHLIDRQFWGDAIYVIEEFEENEPDWLNRNPHVEDSLHFRAGWAAYNRERLQYAGNRFGKVSPASPDYYQAGFYRSYLFAHLSVHNSNPDYLKTAVRDLENLNPDREILKELQSFELAGMALLQRDYERYAFHADKFTGDYFAFVDQQENLHEYHHQLSNTGGKSPFTAGLMSAIIPGSGKIYAGRRGDGISTFLQVAVFGSVFAESALNAGWQHPRTWISGGAFGLFYTANIWGSVVSVRITKEELYEQIDQQILLDLHIPLRSVF